EVCKSIGCTLMFKETKIGKVRESEGEVGKSRADQNQPSRSAQPAAQDQHQQYTEKDEEKRQHTRVPNMQQLVAVLPAPRNGNANEGQEDAQKAKCYAASCAHLKSGWPSRRWGSLQSAAIAAARRRPACRI